MTLVTDEVRLPCE